MQDDDVTVTRRPLTLNAEQLPIDFEDHVVATAFSDSTVDVDPELDRRRGNRSLCNVPFLICREYGAQASNRIGRAMY